MRIALATLALNEMEHLPRLWQQHRDWPGLVRWVFVEAADRVYAATNPDLVTSRGLSVDGTSEYLTSLAKEDDRVLYLPYGFSGHTDPAQGKCAARQQYLNAAESVEPDYLVVLDADEFYPRPFQAETLKLCASKPDATGFVFRHREIWHPPALRRRPLFEREVVGGFWDIPYCRFWRWRPGLTYSTNHNTPEAGGVLLDKHLARFDREPDTPYYCHLAFASDPGKRRAKHNYYQARGEGRTDQRGWYVESRAAWETWKPGVALPRGATVRRYDGLVPEVFQ